MHAMLLIYFPEHDGMLHADWYQFVKETAVQLAADLGVPASASVIPQLYKLLLYKPGDHFAPHRDTEKAPGMFATMAVLLPSAYAVRETIYTCIGRRMAGCHKQHMRTERI